MKNLAAVGTVGMIAAIPLPEPSEISEFKPSKDSSYVMEFDRPISDHNLARIKEQWKSALGANAPTLIIVVGAKLKRL